MKYQPWWNKEQRAFAEAWELDRAHKHAEAIKKYDQAMVAGEDNQSIHRNRGWCYRRLGKNEQALADWAHIPEFAIARARALLDLGRLEEAVVEIKLAIKKYADKEDVVEYKQLLADTLAKLGRGDEARRARPKPAAPSTLADAAPIPRIKKGDSYDAYASRLLAAAGLATHTRTFENARVPAVLLLPIKRAAKLGSSRAGGLPDLPAATHWPAHKQQPMLFVMQVRLEEVAPLLPRNTLPSGGLLSLFVCEGSAHDEYVDAVSVVFTPAKACASLVSRAQPTGLVRRSDGKLKRSPFGSTALDVVAARKLQNPAAPELAKLPQDVRDRYSSHVFEPALAAFSGTHQLLGVRDRSYAGVPKGSRLLFQCVTEPKLDMHWGDDDVLSVFASTASFAKAAFARAVITCGD